jgi:hypothetical protein
MQQQAIEKRAGIRKIKRASRPPDGRTRGIRPTARGSRAQGRARDAEDGVSPEPKTGCRPRLGGVFTRAREGVFGGGRGGCSLKAKTGCHPRLKGVPLRPEGGVPLRPEGGVPPGRRGCRTPFRTQNTRHSARTRARGASIPWPRRCQQTPSAEGLRCVDLEWRFSRNPSDPRVTGAC